MRQILAEREFPADEVRFFASARSAGTVLPYAGREIVVEDAATADPSGLDIALFSAGAIHLAGARPDVTPRPGPWWSTTPRRSGWTPTSRWWSPRSTPTRSRDARKGIIANPNCTTMAAMPVLKPLHDDAGLVRLIASTYQAVSGSAASPASTSWPPRSRPPATRRASWPTTARRWRSPSRSSTPAPSPTTCCRWPARSSTTVCEETDEEQKLRNESRKILGIPELRVSGICVRVPVFTGHSLAINAEFAAPMTVAAGARAARRRPGRRAVRHPDPAAGRGQGPVVRRPVAPGPGRRRRPRAGAVRQQRQPAQGRRAQHRADRRAGRLRTAAELSRCRRTTS